MLACVFNSTQQKELIDFDSLNDVYVLCCVVLCCNDLGIIHEQAQVGIKGGFPVFPFNRQCVNGAISL